MHRDGDPNRQPEPQNIDITFSMGKYRCHIGPGASGEGDSPSEALGDAIVKMGQSYVYLLTRVRYSQEAVDEMIKGE